MRHLIILLLVGCFYACNKGDDPEPINYEFNTKVENENLVTLSWTNIDLDKELQISISQSEKFDLVILDTTISAGAENLVLNQLEALSTYFAKIKIISTNEEVWEEIISFNTSHTNETFSAKTSDQLNITGWIAYIKTKVNAESRLIIFMHEFTNSKSSWTKTTLVDSLIKDGHYCIAFDFRGHGSSSSLPDRNVLINEPWQLVYDFNAVVSFLTENEYKTSKNIIVLGASMGATVATIASSYPQVIGGVAASTAKQITEQANSGPVYPKGMFFIAGELDKSTSLNIDYEIDANALYDICRSPRKIKIVDGSSKHGVDLLKSDELLTDRCLTWVRKL